MPKCLPGSKPGQHAPAEMTSWTSQLYLAPPLKKRLKASSLPKNSGTSWLCFRLVTGDSVSVFDL